MERFNRAQMRPVCLQEGTHLQADLNHDTSETLRTVPGCNGLKGGGRAEDKEVKETWQRPMKLQARKPLVFFLIKRTLNCSQ